MLTLHLDRDSPVPLHYQIQRQLRDALRDGRLRAGESLPQEIELAAQAGVARSTMRQALDALVRDGLLERRRGLGTFVCEPPLAQDLDHFYSFARDMALQGLHPVSRVLRFSRLAPAPEVREALALGPRDRVAEVVRLRLVGDEPLLLESSYLPAGRVPGLARADLVQGSLYDLLERRYQIAVSHAEEELRTVLLEGETAAMLQVPAGTAGFAVERRTFAGEVPVELRRSAIRGDRYRFRVSLPKTALARS